MERRKTGGRQKGTPNRVSGDMKAILAGFASDYYNSGEFLNDFNNLEAKDRLDIFTKLLPYFMPKMQAVQADINATASKTIEDTLIRLAEANE